MRQELDRIAKASRRHWPLQAVLHMQREHRLTVMIFHRVLAQHDPLRPHEPTVDEFAHRMRWVRDNFSVMPLDVACRGLTLGTLPRRALSITFDDGYADNCILAAPILRKLGLHATFFVASGYLDGGLMFNDAVIEALRQARGRTVDLSQMALGLHVLDSDDAIGRSVAAILDGVKYLPQREREQQVHRIAQLAQAELPGDLMMRSDQLRALHAMGMGIGAHTQTHPILTRVSLDVARREIDEGRRCLEDLTGARVGVFAYPNGRPGRDYGAEHVALVRELGFDAAVSTARGAARPGSDPFQIPRFTPWDRGDWRYGLRIAQTAVKSDYACA